MLPYVNLRPPFNITRSSHVRLTVADLAESRNFYVNVIGLVVSDEDESVCYLRGLQEACHHSLVLEQAREGGTCRRIGFRVFFDEDLDAAYDYFRENDLPAEWVEMPYQGRTLHVSDPVGTPLELCATMETRPRMHIRFETFKGAHAQRIDHYPDPGAGCLRVVCLLQRPGLPQFGVPRRRRHAPRHVHVPQGNVSRSRDLPR